jgi:hypothetical protein
MIAVAKMVLNASEWEALGPPAALDLQAELAVLVRPVDLGLSFGAIIAHL